MNMGPEKVISSNKKKGFLHPAGLLPFFKQTSYI